MTRRPAVTLIEVLVSMFIMAIGMLALLVLFPLGAINMAQALKDDRCASTASMAENVAIAKDIRHDPNVILGFTNGGPPNAAVLNLFVDPHGVIGLPPPPPVTPSYVRPPFGWPLGNSIPRVTPSFVSTAQTLADRWFCLPDDVTFTNSGTPDTTSGFVQRGQRYSYAYLLKQQATNSQQGLMQLYVVVYSGRPIGALTPEQVYSSPPTAPLGTAGNNFVSLPAVGTGIKIGGWIFDAGNGDFYRVTNITEAGGGTVVEVQPTLLANVNTAVQMDHVAEVIDKGTSWQP